MSVTRVWVHRIEIPDTPGSLRNILLKFADEGVDLLCIAACTVDGKGLVDLCGKNPMALKAAMKKMNISAIEMSGFLIKDKDQIGKGAKALKGLADAGINGIAGSAMVFDGQFQLLIIVDAKDGDAGEKALKG